MSQYIPLYELAKKREANTIVAYFDEKIIYWEEFSYHISLVMKYLGKKESWVLVCDDSYWFSVGFFAILHSNKKIILPANGLPKTLTALPEKDFGLITDCQNLESFYTVHIPSIINKKTNLLCDATNQIVFEALEPDTVCIEIFTSGTTGDPKKILKNINNLSSEIEGLEFLWGKIVDKCITLATVSHQHIYGLLFRLLWPLCSGRAIVNLQFEYPETLLAYVQRLNDLGLSSLLVSSPAHLKRMIQLINISTLKPGVKKIFSSGGPLSWQTALYFRQEFEQAPIEVFGSTETGGVAYRQQIKELQRWVTFDNVNIHLRDIDSALLVKSPYLLDDDWFVMGDRIELFDDKTFLLNGRIDRIVKIEEKRLSLSEMELRLKKHVWIDDVKLLVLTGSRDQLVGVIILSKEGQLAFKKSGRRIMALKLRELLSAYYEKIILPRKWRYVSDFPRDSLGKVTQEKLKCLFNKKEIS